ncbi:xanthine dehydrogenase family protein molybdopterin-binding subunit [Nocardioides conyzicola]|uniref:Xanthine dehydrogenase family protein molybdopterin-binding subunit n=1 Tax=Nocardioides conyzicola TaxID=1651781 RepID=A0ABP8X2L6_9ACTN
MTGSIKFADDLTPAGTLHGALVRLPVARARLISTDATEALSTAGVVRVFTASDFGDAGPPRFGPVVRDQPVLAFRETRYYGEPVALVVAETRDAAVAGAARFRVDFESLPGWHTVEGAAAADPLHTDDYPHLAHDDGPNVMGRWDFGWGDLAEAEATSALVLDNRYEAPFAHHFAIETYSAVAIPEAHGVTVRDTVQHPFQLRRVIADMLELPASSVRVRATPMGGSFGGKGYAKLGPVVAVFSRLLGRPLKITLSGEESFLTGQREACEVRIRTGFDANGRLTFQELHADFLVGAYADISTRVVSKSGLHACGPYRTPAAKVVARGLYTTTPPTTAFRGFGAGHLVFAVEGQMDEAASRLGIDPVELRLRNMKERGEPTVAGETPVDGDWPELVRMAATAMDWHVPVAPGRGRGLAFGMKSCVPATTSQATVRMAADGSVCALVGTSEMGQGAVMTYAALVADWLGLARDQVIVQMADTAVVPFDALTASSRSLVHMGRALQDAVGNLSDAVREHAADLGGVAATDVSIVDGVVKAGEWRGTYQDVMSATFGPGSGELQGRGQFRMLPDANHVLGGPTPFFEAVVTAVELSIDAETGLLDVHRVVHVTDAGRIINRTRAIGLDEGGVVMGMGLALSEQLVYREGALLNGSSLDYRIPSIVDIPRESVSLFQENGDGPGPQGSKGLAEGGILAVAPALAAAVQHATGARIRELPITAERIWAEMQDIAAAERSEAVQ